MKTQTTKTKATAVKRTKSLVLGRKKRIGTKSKTRITTSRTSMRQSRALHKRVLLHPITVFAILCVGVCLVALTYRALADTIISSVIEAPSLPLGSPITTPSDGDTFTAQAVTVGGTCPTDSYVKVYVNSVLGGVALCDTGNQFNVQTSLVSGDNTLTAQDYNQTDVAGPATPAVHVTYTPPPAPPTPATPPAPSPAPTTPGTMVEASPIPADTGKPLSLTADYDFKTTVQQQTFTWTVDLEGGTPPYDVDISWGDGTSSTLHFATDPVFTISHVYDVAGYYPIVLTSVDTTGEKRIVQLAATITTPSGKVIPSTPTTEAIRKAKATENVASHGGKPSTGSSVKHWLLFAWPAYLVVAFMSFAFWLGERRVYMHATKPRRTR